MPFQLSDEQQLIQRAARDFACGELANNAVALDQGVGQDIFFKNLKALAELGFMGLNIDPELGGSGAGSIAFSLAITELAKACASTAVTVSVTNMVAEVIQSVASAEQKAFYLPKICSGEYPAAGFCLTEPGAGSDPSAMRTSAAWNGSEWVLNGAKAYITSGEFAGVFVVWAVTDKNAPRGKGISCFLVERQTPGLVVGPAEDKMGQKGSATNPVYFDDCRIPASALMGELNRGYQVALGELAGGRIGIGSLALGVGMAAMEYARDYAREREQFGQPIANFQAIQWMLADGFTELEAARLLLMQAAYLKEANLDFASQASMAKLFATEAANRACYSGQQILGGHGYNREYPLERFARDVRITSIYEGTSEIQRMIIARKLLA
ncbi:acyl-CoA dehydrogenase family protein [Spongiibacter taiwanensis]|uniref:acyl-CoA dehydrogenase family protein n=1 Tax=Spongiibacter taiwanensis TaxID=1748242 RepID=UPI0020361F42|nr:acyl-CoA dehydrogenase family protein [Spongiibacter taiwanensis]USA44698.1 acyl-CoA dehydrogenase family protein [Spongiibacter taiwanensis]